MDMLSINQQVLIMRSDGRVHPAVITKLEGGTNNAVTVEWPEGDAICGKDLSLDAIIEMNPQILRQPSSAFISYGENHPHLLQMVAHRNRNTIGAAVVLPIPRRPQANSPELQQMTAGIVDQKVRTTSRQRRVGACVLEVDRLRESREKRRARQAVAREEINKLKKVEANNPNWQIARMIALQRESIKFTALEGVGQSQKHHQIVVCVRKRPLSRKELFEKELDIISVPTNNLLIVHEPRRQVNLTKYLDNHKFSFDYIFNEQCTNEIVYEYTAKPLVNHIFDGGMSTCFAYGQTGSGKTHTMSGQFTSKLLNCRDGIYALAAKDVFENLCQPKFACLGLKVTCTFFEIYGSRVFDLLVNGKQQLRVLEDGHQKVQVVGLREMVVSSTEDVLKLIELGNAVRTCGQTSANSKSSRSHAVFQIVLRGANANQLHGKFSLIDLAGNERGADNCSLSRQTRLEGSDINKSLLALKECIRALGLQSKHLPFRASKLTQVLRDSFIGGKKVKTCMIAMISPGLRCCEHTLNTLRYADRVKELSSPESPKTFRRKVRIDSFSNVDVLDDLIEVPGRSTLDTKTVCQNIFVEDQTTTKNNLKNLFQNDSNMTIKSVQNELSAEKSSNASPNSELAYLNESAENNVGLIVTHTQLSGSQFVSLK